MNIEELILKNRSYRRFNSSRELTKEDLRGYVESGRISQSAANCQPLRYVTVCSKDLNREVCASLKWAGYLPEWPGPEEGERPTGYIVVLTDTTIEKDPQVDAGLAIQNITLTAAAQNVGSCILGSIDRKKLRNILSLEKKYNILYVVALGYPVEEVRLVELTDGVEYYRDENQVHYVPKRSLDDVIISEN